MSSADDLAEGSCSERKNEKKRETRKEEIKSDLNN
jgi:hypothetical protein